MSCLYRHSSLEDCLNKKNEKQAIKLQVATNKKVENRAETFCLRNYCGIKTCFKNCGEIHISELLCLFKDLPMTAISS